MAASQLLALVALVASASALKSSQRSSLLGRQSSPEEKSLKERFPYAQTMTVRALLQETQRTRQGTLGKTAHLLQHGGDDDTQWSVAGEETADEPTVPMTKGEASRAQHWFVGFVVSSAVLTSVLMVVTTKCLALPQDSEESATPEPLSTRAGYLSYVRGLPIYNIATPAIGGAIALMVYFSVIGAIRLQNKMILDPAYASSAPGYASNIYLDRISNYGERAFFASFSLVLQACLGVAGLLVVRKYYNVQMSTAMVLKYVCRGAAMGILSVMIVEFVHLPYQDTLKNNDDILERIILVLFVTGALVLIQDLAKVGSLAIGLRREVPAPDAEETGYMRYLAAVLEAPRAVALAGLAAGVGFAFIDNIPRLLSVAVEPPLVSVSESSWGGETEQIYLNESDQRSVRIVTVLFWVVLNLHPFLSGLAAIKLAEHTGGAKILTPKALVEVLKVVCALHFAHDLLSRSTSTWVLLLSISVLPYSINLFRKEWSAIGDDSQGEGLLDGREDDV